MTLANPISLRFPQATYDRLHAEAKRLTETNRIGAKVTVTMLVRLAVEDYLEKADKNGRRRR